jgi:hypothetical protein
MTIEYIADPGKTFSARLYAAGSTTVVQTVSLPSIASGRYAGTPSGLAANAYVVGIFEGSTSTNDYGVYYWDGTQEVTPNVLATAISNVSGGGGGGSGDCPTASQVATAVQTALATTLANIQAAADLSALPLSADLIAVDETTAIATYTKDGSIQARYQLKNGIGVPNVDTVRRQEKLL